jgi:lysophospholipase L1-like esterase
VPVDATETGTPRRIAPVLVAILSLLVGLLALPGQAHALPVAAAAARPVNLLGVNQASVESSLAGFARGTGRERLVRTTALAIVGRSSLEMVATTARSMAVRTVMQGQVVSPGGTYAASVCVRALSTSRPTAKARVQVAFLSATGRALATRVGAWTSTRATGWTRVGVTSARAPAGTASVSLVLVVASTRTGTAYAADAWGLWRAASLPAWTLPVVAPDSIRPTSPSRVTVAASSDPGTLTVSWAPSTDNVAVRRYQVTLTSIGGAAPVVGSVTGTRWTSGLLPLGPWHASVVAIDRSGLVSSAGAADARLSATGSAVNLLSADQGSVETSTAGFDLGSVSVPAALSRSSVAASGAASLRIAPEGSGSLNVRTSRSWTPAYPGSPYSSSVLVRASTGVPAGTRAHIEVRFYAASATIAPVIRSGGSVVLSSSTWTRLTLAGQVAPSTARTVTVGVVVDNAAAGQVYLADEFGVWRAAAVPAWALPPARTARPLVVMLGDSYTAGTGASVETSRWSTLVATSQGWRETNLARGGTGWATTSTTGCGLVLCPTLAQMAGAAVQARPDVVLVSAGRNDLTIYQSNKTLVRDSIEQTIATLRAGLPHARIVVISPMWDSSAVNPGILEMATWTQQSAAAHGAQWVGGASSWLLGHPEWVSADAVHPADAGHAQIAHHVLAALG